MINITSADGSLITTNYGVTGPYISAPSYTGRELTGDMRYCNGIMQVYDGSNWTVLNVESGVELPVHTQQVLDWAEDKMLEEMKLKELCEKYPTLKDAKDKYETIKALVQNDE